MQMTVVDASGRESVALQINRLAIIGGRYTRVTNQHATENLPTSVSARYINATGFVAQKRDTAGRRFQSGLHPPARKTNVFRIGKLKRPKLGIIADVRSLCFTSVMI